MMTSSTISSQKIDHQQQLRKVAILVATLDEPLAERLLADLPAREEDAVRKMVEQLGEIDPEEYRAVVADFRKGLSLSPKTATEPLPTKMEGVELDPSLLARMANDDFSTPMPESKLHASPWQTLSDADATTLVEMLSAEQPQTVAVVLSKLETSRSAELLMKLPPALQAEVLTRLADLDPADEQTLEVVASQLSQWLTAQRQRRQRRAAGCELVQRILQDTPDDQRTVLLSRLDKRNPELAEKLAGEALVNSSAIRKSQSYVQSYAQRPTVSSSSMGSSTQASTLVANESADPLKELESLDDNGLLRALRYADRATVMLALAGASESLMKRIVKDLPRRKANQFRQQVRAIGPTRLSDMVAAQRELLFCGRESPVVSCESRENVPFAARNS